MSAGFKATWLGDEDPQAQLVRMGDLAFVKGQSVSVPKDHPMADAIRHNPTFAVDAAKADVVDAKEPDEDERNARSEEGTEKAALKADLRNLGIVVQGNPSVDTLRARLADATK